MERNVRGVLLASVVAVAGCGSGAGSGYGGGGVGPGDNVGGTGSGQVVTPPTVVVPAGSATPVIADALRRQDGRLRACWDRLMLDHPELVNGRVDVRFQLDPAGLVRSADVVSGSSEDPSFRTCVEEQARGMSFPQGDASSVFSHSFTFGVGAGTGVE
jgi:hypothetical protein